MRLIITVGIILLFYNSNGKTNDNLQLVGLWQCTTYDILVSTYIQNNSVSANLLKFPCSHKIKLPLKDHLDIHNPDPNKRGRSMYNVQILSNLQYSNNGKWINGKVYVPATGQNYHATLTLNTPTQIQIRGYIGFEFIGKTLIFNKINKEIK